MSDNIYLGLKKDGEYYPAPNEQAFISAYEKTWTRVMADTYFPSEKMDVGHKLRPRLVYWGFLYRNSTPNTEEYEAIGKLAVSIELIHKASLLIDDYIDRDTARHGRPAFYTEHGVERTIIYSLNLLSTALSMINKVFAEKEIAAQYFTSMASIIDMLESMTRGVLKELDLGVISSHGLLSIKEIMILETAELISSSLVSGYSLAGGDISAELCLLKSIGKKVGFVFQILNDMEPFAVSNHDHKGSINIDIGRRRKNYCVAIINELASRKERKKLDQCEEADLEQYIFQLLERYKVLPLLQNECRTTLADAIEEVKNTTTNQGWASDFNMFIQSVYDVSSTRLHY